MPFTKGHQLGITHGNARNGIKTPTYSSWTAMIQRCMNKNSTNYFRYGKRGIKVCKRWLDEDGFQNFLADMGERPKGMSIDRKDNDGNYTPANCKWATKSEQSRNQRIRSDNTTGWKGIYWFKQTNKWMAGIGINGKQVHLGFFKDKEDAYMIRLAAEEQLLNV